MKWREIITGLAKLIPLDGRGNLEPGPKETVILNDSRRANPASTVAGLQTLADLSAKRKIAVLGEMGELGKYSEEGHRSVGHKVAEIKPDYVVCVGGATKFIAEEARKGMKKNQVIFVKDVFEAAGVLSGILKKGDLWYLKGSLLKHLERIPLILEGRDVDPDEIASKRYEIYR
jgi:UDP-N-acetylmuramyl pentapeptide synthase